MPSASTSPSSSTPGGRTSSSRKVSTRFSRQKLMANLGFVGLGARGSRNTNRLLAKGPAVTGYELFPAKQPELVAMGGKWASSPRAVCDAADTTFVMVTNTAALEGAS